MVRRVFAVPVAFERGNGVNYIYFEIKAASERNVKGSDDTCIPTGECHLPESIQVCPSSKQHLLVT